MDPSYRKELSNSGNLFIGEHTSVQVCGWTKKALRGEGACYKGKFYGIKSHRCVQMSPAVNFCDHDCVFCWRSRNNSGFGKIDDPMTMTDLSIDAQRKLLTGFGGHPKVSREKWEQGNNPLHFAISLNGEPTYYPRMSEFIKDLKDKNMSSFLVTNGQLPEVLEKIEPPTQLYISVDASNKESYVEIDRPMRKDGWARLMRSLDILRKMREEEKTRTVIRITVIKGLNDKNPEEWAELIKRANPMFVEVKGYMFVGASRQRLSLKNMPYHEEIVEFSNQIAKLCGRTIASDHAPSRVTLLMEEGCERAPWRHIKFAKESDVYKKAYEKDTLPELDEKGLFVEADTPCDGCHSDELSPQKAEALIKLK